MPKNKGWVNWRNHPAREILLFDFNRGGFLYELEEYDLPLLYQTYTQVHPDYFSEVVFEQFEARMEDYIKTQKGRRERSKLEEEWMVHDRQLHPRQSKNSRGELVLDLHPAKFLLREDIKNKLHKTMEPEVFRNTRQEYLDFGQDIFRQRIYQEIRYQKYCNHLEDKRKKKREEWKKEKEEKAKKERKRQERKKAQEQKRQEKEAQKERKRQERKRAQEQKSEASRKKHKK